MSSSNLEALKKIWTKVGDCQGCKKRRAAIRKFGRSFLGNEQNAVFFSGGYDSTYVVHKLLQDGVKNIKLYHLRYLYDHREDGRDNAQEYSSAQKLAEKFNLPLILVGTIRVESRDVMRMPMLAASVICHRRWRFDNLYTGMAPTLNERDAHWDDLLKTFAAKCMPDLKVHHPRDGILRDKVKSMVPEDLVPLVYESRRERYPNE